RIRFPLLLHVGRPRRTTRRMAGSPNRPQCGPTERDRIAVLQDTIDFHRFPSFVSQRRHVLAGGKRCGIGSECHDFGARRLLHCRMSLDVIEVRVPREQNFDVLQLEPELCHIRDNNLVHLFRARVDHDVAFGRCNQIRSDVLRADIVNVADDPKWFDRLTHLAMKCCPLFRRERRSLSTQKRRTDQNQQQGITHRDLRQFILLERNEDGTSYGSVFAWLGACYAMIEIRTPRALTNSSGAATAPLRGSHARSSIVDMPRGSASYTKFKTPSFCLIEVPLELTKELEFVERTWKEFAKESASCEKTEGNSKRGCPDFCVSAGSPRMEDRWNLTM